ncbi:hypothetical protein ESB00_08420 [Oleiharenicola lentus]|uniref:Xylose isomerase-like TIM barrel domain-containing protein n=1 Tax=Oleiharenicola lentus TaxID=2508720 RepID=A0A4Q1CAF8_9BACT|nr:TIM barrel protein [Oleiharenicola lentus]RXK55890.1 hypothetical protein ESB00_08420 [Oleiharenicola lentus]
MDWSRRRFLETLAAGAALAAARLSVRAANGLTDQAHDFDIDAVHVFAKPFRALDYASASALIAEAGGTGIDFAVRRGGHVEPARASEDLPRAVAAARAAGLRTATISSDIVAATPEARRLLTAARDAGIRVYRLGHFTFDASVGPWATLQRLKPQLEALATLNAEIGIHGAIQNHSGNGRVGAAGWDLHELVRDHDPRWLGCQFDIRHATAIGATSWGTTFDLLAPWVHSIVLKDFRWLQHPGEQRIEDVPLGDGICDLAGFVRRVARLSQPVTCSLHLEFEPFEPAPAAVSPQLRTELVGGLRRELDTLTSLLRGLDRVGG